MKNRMEEEGQKEHKRNIDISCEIVVKIIVVPSPAQDAEVVDAESASSHDWSRVLISS